MWVKQVSLSVWRSKSVTVRACCIAIGLEIKGEIGITFVSYGDEIVVKGGEGW